MKAMAADPARSLELTRPRDIDAVASPARLELLTVLGSLGRATVRELAERVGRAPSSLYYHLEALVRAGAVAVVERRARGRTREAVYAPAARRVALAPPPGSPRAVAATRRALGAMLRLTGREVGRALQREDVRREGPARELVGTRLKARLTRADLEQVHRHLARIEAVFQRGARRRAGRLYAWTSVLAPGTDGPEP